jgi:Asp-tRNA(Asn)/Glu-tRNA(Gln) amidotransferase A subunit family amidase
MIRSRQVKPSEITAAVLERVEALNPIVGAFITVTAELATEEAAAADKRAERGEYISAMDGIPYSIKDLEATAGIRTTQGSKFFSDVVPDEDSAVAGLLRASGGILLGKTNTPHFGYKDMCDNFVAPSAVNPWDTRMTAGGSSGGAAAAVASGLGPIAQGGDGAGSIRIPAALCGVVGFKPSFGRVPLYPATNAWTTRVHNGPIARTVADAALMLTVLAKPDDRDPASLSTELPPFAPSLAAKPLAGTRAVFCLDFGYGVVSAEVEKRTREAVEVMRSLGCEIDEVDTLFDNPAPFHAVMYGGGGIPPAFLEHPEWVEEDFMRLLTMGQHRKGSELVWAETTRSEFYQSVMALMRTYDFIVSPSMPLEAWSAVPGRGPREIDGKPLDEMTSRAFLLYPFNLTGQPAISLPVGFSTAGLPVGLQIVGRRQRDMEVLHAAAALESALDVGRPWPTPTERPAGIDGVVPTSTDQK